MRPLMLRIPFILAHVEPSEVLGQSAAFFGNLLGALN